MLNRQFIHSRMSHKFRRFRATATNSSMVMKVGDRVRVYEYLTRTVPTTTNIYKQVANVKRVSCNNNAFLQQHLQPATNVCVCALST